MIAVLLVLGLSAPGLPAPIEAAVDQVSWTPAKVSRLIERMPKVELHLHLDGALTPELIQALAREQDHPTLRDKSLDEIRRLATIEEPRASLAAALEVFHVVLSVLRRPEAVERVAYDLARRARGQNILYFEARFAPALMTGPSLSAEEALRSALRGLRRGERDFGVQSAVIICLIRPFELVSRRDNEAMLDLAIRYREQGVVGLDVAGDEAALGLEAYRDLLLAGRRVGLRLTPHAGEVAGGRNLETALELGVDRLGHASQLREKPELRAEVARRGIVVEISPTSNLRTAAITSYEAHPAPGWLREGLRLAPSSDDPGIFGIDLVHEYRVLAERMGLTPRELVAVSLQALDGVFLPAGEKADLRRRFEAELLRLLGELAGGPVLESPAACPSSSASVSAPTRSSRRSARGAWKRSTRPRLRTPGVGTRRSAPDAAAVVSSSAVLG